ncbi:MAG: DUF3179 domain-containing (seleno)protein [Acidimicrobiia bacterium]
MRLKLITLSLVLAACGGTAAVPSTAPQPTFPQAPTAPTGELSDQAAAALDEAWKGIFVGLDPEAITAIGAAGDVRAAWPLSDLMRFSQSIEGLDATRSAFEELTGTALTDAFPWTEATNLLMAWDIPAPPGYVDLKRALFTQIDERWEPFFAEPTTIDYRLLGWGGVLIDDRPLGSPNPCPQGCIPSLDDPGVTDAAGGDWLDDDFPVFGIVLGGEARAYPRHIMEVHEMVNDTLGGERIAFAYCTLCGAAQAYLSEGIVMRTSGLLSRSNKVMFDLVTMSAFDTFTGRAVSGPLLSEGVQLEQVSVVTTSWGEWKAEHPDTTMVAEDGGIFRSYPLDPLGGRDDDGPIFPIGAIDPRLGVHEQVLGVVLDDGSALAFPVAASLIELRSGGSVELSGVALVTDGGGLRAELTDGTPMVSHQAFWFAWSQFHSDTALWEAPE